jgi:hydroxymethylpyrimidine/phosphomethylpyrimidine kinase
MMHHKVLSIAGFDGSGGAGIQADLKTISAFGCYGMTVLTALPVQNTCGVRSCYEIPLPVIQEQLETIFDDIVPDAIKIGMLFDNPIIELVVDFIKKNAQGIPLVLDPVMVAKSGDFLLRPEAVSSLKEKLVPLADLITPNLSEAQALCGMLAQSKEEMLPVATQLHSLGAKSILLKGGHLEGELACDLYLHCDSTTHWLETPRIKTKNTHGTGCALSAALASCLALGLDSLEACRISKRYLQEAIIASQNQNIGSGHGPVHHFYHLWPTLEKIKGEQNAIFTTRLETDREHLSSDHQSSF